MALPVVVGAIGHKVAQLGIRMVVAAKIDAEFDKIEEAMYKKLDKSKMTVSQRVRIRIVLRYTRRGLSRSVFRSSFI